MVIDSKNHLPLALAGIVGFLAARALKINPWLGAGLAAVGCWLWLKSRPSAFEAMNTLQENANSTLP
jgi:hypothetical protein